MVWFWDWTLIFLIPAVLLVGYAQAKVRSAFARYSEVKASSGLSGAEAAARVLAGAGIAASVRQSAEGSGARRLGVTIVPVEGDLSDNYDPSSRRLNLSKTVYYGDSLAALGVAAHEAGHAMQHAQGYRAMALRTSFVPMANLGQGLAPILFIVGFLFGSPSLMNIGILFFAGAVLFMLVTLPVEFNASGRAVRALRGSGLVTEQEEAAVKKVLSAAALTYVAMAAYMLLQLVRLLVLRSSRD